jgi:hypothetical protein
MNPITAAAIHITLAVAALGTAAASTADAPTAAVWQERKGSIGYFGLTSTYSCTGIEGRIRQILVFLGARKDLSVNAGVCDSRDMPMGHSMTVNVRLFSLAPAFMADGDCELIDQMHEFIERNFDLRNLQYHAACQPRQVTMASFSVRGELLKIVTP